MAASAGSVKPQTKDRRSAGPLSFPLWQIDQLEYLGAFRIPNEKFGESTANWAQGPIEYDAATDRLWLVGHTEHQAVAEFQVPEIVASRKLSELAVAAPPVQGFVSILGRVESGNPETLDRIGGMELVKTSEGSVLLVNAFEYYDAPADNTLSTLVVRDPQTIGRSRVDGFYRYRARAGASAGWLSALPPEWQDVLSGDLLTGSSSGIPIISRTSVGPSAFVFDSKAMLGEQAVQSHKRGVPVKRLLEFSLEKPLHQDLSNDQKSNKVWTHLSRAVFGMVIPGTRTYLTIGHSGGHKSGVCYKCVVSTGEECGGYCARDSEDYEHYYWLWDMADLHRALTRPRAASAIRPYDFGRFDLPFHSRELGGGSFDPSSGRLFVSVLGADRGDDGIRNTPIIVVLDLGLERSGPLAASPEPP